MTEPPVIKIEDKPTDTKKKKDKNKIVTAEIK